MAKQKFTHCRWEPTRAPGPWEGVMQAITSGPVCPQSLPSGLIPWKSHFNDSSFDPSMPKPRLRFLQLLRTQLLRQSEDCLYLNVFVPKMALINAQGKMKRILLHWLTAYSHSFFATQFAKNQSRENLDSQELDWPALQYFFRKCALAPRSERWLLGSALK